MLIKKNWKKRLILVRSLLMKNENRLLINLVKLLRNVIKKKKLLGEHKIEGFLIPIVRKLLTKYYRKQKQQHQKLLL